MNENYYPGMFLLRILRKKIRSDDKEKKLDTLNTKNLRILSGDSDGEN